MKNGAMASAAAARSRFRVPGFLFPVSHLILLLVYRPSRKESADKRALTLRRAQGERGNTCDDKPSTAQAEPFDGAQDMLVEAGFASLSTLSEKKRPLQGVTRGPR